MTKLRDCIWVCGHTPNPTWYEEGLQNPEESRQEVEEVCRYLGIGNAFEENLGRFDDEPDAWKVLERVVCPILGLDTGRDEEDECDEVNAGDLEEVIRHAQRHPNIVGGIMDGFLHRGSQRKLFNPVRLRMMRRRLREEAGRPLEFWTVCYDHELDMDVHAYLSIFDVITFWSCQNEVPENFGEHLAEVIELNPGKRFLAGCSMWDVADGKPLSAERMERQLETYWEFMREGGLQGFILGSASAVDLGMPVVEFTKAWIAEHGEEAVMA